MNEKREKLLRAECDIYRSVVIQLYCDATSGKRKTLDKAYVARITDSAIERGNEVFRRAKTVEAYCNHDAPAVWDGVCECGERVS